MPKQPDNAICPVCERRVALTRISTFRKHRSRPSHLVDCPGSGRKHIENDDRIAPSEMQPPRDHITTPFTHIDRTARGADLMLRQINELLTSYRSQMGEEKYEHNRRLARYLKAKVDEETRSPELDRIRTVLKMGLTNAVGTSLDDPEGSRVVIFSETLIKQMLESLGGEQ